MHWNLKRTGATVFALLLVGTAGEIRSASACACGAMVANDKISVGEEQAIVRVGDEKQTIVLGLGVQSVTKDAALVLPTPNPAKVKRADAEAFRDLASVSAPKTEYVDDWWPRHFFNPGPMSGEGSDPSAVDVLDQSKLGSFDVATLAAEDSEALNNWLEGHGYQLDDTVEDALRPYVERNWYYVAVKLNSADEQPIDGDMEPLRVDFAADKPVYPMRLSAAAEGSQVVRLYLLGEHRMRRVDSSTESVPARTSYAGRVDNSDMSTTQAADLVSEDGAFLTTLDHSIADPSKITSDFRFAPAESDNTHARERTVKRPVYILGMAGGPFLMGAGVFLLVAIVAAVAMWGRRKRLSWVNRG